MSFKPLHGNYPVQYDNDRYILAGEVEWMFSGTEAQIIAVERVLGNICTKLSPEILLLNFGNAVGIFRVPEQFTIEVVSSKWNQQHYGQMLSDITEIATGLPFTAAETAALPYDRSSIANADITYHTFVYLRHITIGAVPHEKNLLTALRLILSDPHRHFERRHRDVPLDALRAIAPSTLASIISGSHTLTPVSQVIQSRVPLARYLCGHLPERLTEPGTTTTFDTPENQFVKSFLNIADSILTRMREVLTALPSNGENIFRTRILSDCATIENALAPLLANRFWQEIGSMTHLPVTSTVLQRRYGYREVFEHFAKIRLATQIPLSRNVILDLLEAKDIARLYEMWSYFRVLRETQTLLGPPATVLQNQLRQSDTDITLPWEIEVRWHNRVSLTYNAHFSQKRAKPRHSYSLPLRPDIVLHVPQGTNAGLHLFDAKFKTNQGASIPRENDERIEDTSEPEQNNKASISFKNDDLHKMHTYLDALPATRSVWILYPGSECKFYGKNGGDEAFLDTGGPQKLEGVGAIPLLPDEHTHEHLRHVLQHLLGG